MNAITFYGDVFLRERFVLSEPLPTPYVFNLEAPLTKAQRGYPGKINLRGSADAFDATFVVPPVAVCLANNHVMDFGEEGFLETVSFLEARGISYFGAGYQEKNCNNPLLLDIEGVGLALMGYVSPLASPVFAERREPGCAPIDLDLIARDMSEAKKRGAKRIIVQLHWGAEQVSAPRREDVETARAIIDLGADLIIGHHAHCIQSFEIYKRKHIFYGLGNCMFPPHTSPAYYDASGRPTKVHVSRSFGRNKRSLAVRLELASKKVEVAPQYFDGKVLRRGRFSPERYHVTIEDLAEQERKFERAFRLGKLTYTLQGYLAEPKLPRWQHIKGISTILRTRQFK